MPIFVNNFVKKDQTKSAPLNEMYWDNEQQKLVKVEKKPEAKPVVKTEPVEQPQEHYKHVRDGDLHKLLNTKSDYLKDMADL